MNKIRKAVIPAAGFGTRFLPQTKAMPKEMLEPALVRTYDPFHFRKIKPADFPFSHLFIEAGESFACARKKDKTADRFI